MKSILATKRSKDWFHNIKVLLAECNHKEQVEFALYCSEDSLPALAGPKQQKEYEASKACIVAIKAWLAEPNEVTREACDKAALAAYWAANAAYLAASAAANMVAYSETDAAYWAAYVVAANKPEKLKEYYEYLFDKLTVGMNKKTLEILWGE